MGLGLVLLNMIYLVASLDSQRQPAGNNTMPLYNETINENEDNSTFFKEERIKNDLLKGIGNILGRLIGGQSIVCTALTDGTKITLEGTSSGMKIIPWLVISS